jgi:hypothetical protein
LIGGVAILVLAAHGIALSRIDGVGQLSRVQGHGVTVH